MYKEIDELVEVICKDKTFIDYKESEKSLDNQDIQSLLSKHQTLQEDYLKVKKYSQYVSVDETRKVLLEVKEEMKDNVLIQNYYNNYYQLNELLEDVTKIVFNNISQDINIEMFKL
ncbi:MAG: YlbF family regulator [Coprobacillus sp.]